MLMVEDKSVFLRCVCVGYLSTIDCLAHIQTERVKRMKAVNRRVSTAPKTPTSGGLLRPPSSPSRDTEGGGGEQIGLQNSPHVILKN